MAAKELVEARWKAIIGGLIALGVAVFVPLSYNLIMTLLDSAKTEQLPAALRQQIGLAVGDFGNYVYFQWFGKNGQMLLGALAAFLGGGLIAGEVSRGTIFFLLSRPVSRDRVLAVKYAINAGLLLGACLLSSLGILAAASAVGHPQDVGGMAVSTLLIWLGTMSILGVALLFSVLFEEVLRPVALALVVAVVVGIPGLAGSLAPDWFTWSLPNYWASLPAYRGAEFPVKELVVCLVAAALPAMVAVSLFRKRAF